MDVLLGFVPLVLMLCVFSAFTKLAARLSRGSKVSWKHCFLYAFFTSLLTIAVRALLAVFNVPLHIALGGMLFLLLYMAVGSWFFANRATSSAGSAVGWRGGAQISGLAFAFLFVVGLVGRSIMNILLSSTQP